MSNMGPYAISGEMAVELPGVVELVTRLATDERPALLQLIVEAIDPDLGMMCPECNGIGQDENAHFWCHPCEGRGWFPSPPEVREAEREWAEELAEIIVSALDRHGWMCIRSSAPDSQEERT